MNVQKLACAVVLAGASVLAAPVSHAQNAVPFDLDGRVIRFIHGQAAGGATDTELRILLERLAGYLPGTPSLVLQSLPGANGLRMLEFGAQLDPLTDLTVMLLTASTPFRARAGLVDGLFDPRTTTWIGSFASSTTVCVTSAAANINSIDDMRSSTVLAGAQNGTGNIYATYMIMNQALGLDIAPVVGYESYASMALALARGEIDLLCGPYSSFATTLKPVVDAGTARLLLYIGERRDDIAAPNLYDLPVLAGQEEFLTAAITSITFPRAFLVPPGTDPAFVAILREAFAAAIVDPEFLSDAGTFLIDVLPRSADDIALMVDQLYATPDALIDQIRTFLAVD